MFSLLVDNLAQLGWGAGWVSPSIYDTAQYIRFCHPPDRQPAISWLLDLQGADGGWGNLEVAHHRAVPTLAAILALHNTNQQRYATEITDGIRFLWEIDSCWAGKIPHDLSVGGEIILPWLIDEARRVDLDVPMGAHDALYQLGQRRRRSIKHQLIKPGTPSMHSWEAWGASDSGQSDLAGNFLDAAGSIGHSPSATAIWLYYTQHQPGFDTLRARAYRYLKQATAATNSDIPGVMPTVWPITRFEQAFGLYGLATINLLQEPTISSVTHQIVDDLAQILWTAGGIGMSDAFEADGDTTAATLAVVRAAGRACPNTADLFHPFVSSGYAAYPGELHGSISVACRILHQVALDGQDTNAGIMMLCTQQQADGTWACDKWNISWLYSAWHAILALSQSRPTPAVNNALAATLQAMLHTQHPDGGWGPGTSRLPDTTFAMLALLALHPTPFRTQAQSMLSKARQWLLQHLNDPIPATWIGKDLYSPQRLDRVLALTALLGSEEDRN